MIGKKDNLENFNVGDGDSDSDGEFDESGEEREEDKNYYTVESDDSSGEKFNLEKHLSIEGLYSAVEYYSLKEVIAVVAGLEKERGEAQNWINEPLDEYNGSIALYAVKYDKLNIFKYLVSKGANINLKSDSGYHLETSLTSLCEKKEFKIVEYILKKETTKVEDIRQAIEDIFRYAIVCTNFEIIKFIVKINNECENKGGIDINEFYEFMGYHGKVKVTLESVVKVCAEMTMKEEESKKIRKHLIENGALDSKEIKELMEQGKEGLFRLKELEKSYDKFGDFMSRTPLSAYYMEPEYPIFLASKYGSIELMEYLKKIMGDENCKIENEYGDTYVKEAIREDHANIIEYTVKNFSDLIFEKENGVIVGVIPRIIDLIFKNDAVKTLECILKHYPFFICKNEYFEKHLRKGNNFRRVLKLIVLKKCSEKEINEIFKLEELDAIFKFCDDNRLLFEPARSRLYNLFKYGKNFLFLSAIKAYKYKLLEKVLKEYPETKEIVCIEDLTEVASYYYRNNERESYLYGVLLNMPGVRYTKFPIINYLLEDDSHDKNRLKCITVLHKCNVLDIEMMVDCRPQKILVNDGYRYEHKKVQQPLITYFAYFYNRMNPSHVIKCLLKNEKNSVKIKNTIKNTLHFFMENLKKENYKRDGLKFIDFFYVLDLLAQEDNRSEFEIKNYMNVLYDNKTLLEKVEEKTLEAIGDSSFVRLSSNNVFRYERNRFIGFDFCVTVKDVAEYIYYLISISGCTTANTMYELIREGNVQGLKELERNIKNFGELVNRFSVKIYPDKKNYSAAFDNSFSCERPSYSKSPLMVAAFFNQVDVIKYFVEEIGVFIDDSNKKGETTLTCSFINDDKSKRKIMTESTIYILRHTRSMHRVVDLSDIDVENTPPEMQKKFFKAVVENIYLFNLVVPYEEMKKNWDISEEFLEKFVLSKDFDKQNENINDLPKDMFKAGYLFSIKISKKNNSNDYGDSVEFNDNDKVKREKIRKIIN